MNSYYTRHFADVLGTSNMSIWERARGQETGTRASCQGCLQPAVWPRALQFPLCASCPITGPRRPREVLRALRRGAGLLGSTASSHCCQRHLSDLTPPPQDPSQLWVCRWPLGTTGRSLPKGRCSLAPLGSVTLCLYSRDPLCRPTPRLANSCSGLGGPDLPRLPWKPPKAAQPPRLVRAPLAPRTRLQCNT